jgi:hypothetical protein
MLFPAPVLPATPVVSLTYTACFQATVGFYGKMLRSFYGNAFGLLRRNFFNV